MAVVAAIRLCKITGHEVVIGWERNDFAFCYFEDLFEHNYCTVQDESVILPDSVFITNQTGGVIQVVPQDTIDGKDVTIIAHHLFYLQSDFEAYLRHDICQQLREAFHTLQPVSVIVEAVARFEPELVNGVGLHIRRNGPIELGFKGRAGDPTMVNVWSYPSDEGYINLASDLISKYRLTGKIFLATTCLTTRQAIINGFEDGKVLFYEGRSYDLHAQAAAIQDALIDILCLSKTAVVTKRHPSTFAFFASIIGETYQAIIYDKGLVEVKTPLAY
jgi:hypothetical protein